MEEQKLFIQSHVANKKASARIWGKSPVIPWACHKRLCAAGQEKSKGEKRRSHHRIADAGSL
jgi:hypothetical protein